MITYDIISYHIISYHSYHIISSFLSNRLIEWEWIGMAPSVLHASGRLVGSSQPVRDDNMISQGATLGGGFNPSEKY